MKARVVLSLLIIGGILLPMAPSFPTNAAVSRSAPFGYGVSVADLDRAAYVTDMGFRYMKVTLSWARTEVTEGHYQWMDGPNDADNIANAAQANNLRLLLRVDNPPAWANGTGGTAPPGDINKFGNFMYALASHLRGKVAAYEIWNEPNLASDWGGSPPDPERYAQMLQAVYPRIKAADPDAIVVSAGMATNGDHSGAALDDLEFIQRMYNAGARPYFDVLGTHPYGFAYAPEQDPGSASGLAFRRAEQQHAVMVANGDGGKQVWATEMGWLLDSGCDWWDRNWQKVSEQTQADYLVRAFQYARDNWAWMGVMFAFNLDFGSSYYQGGCPGNSDMCNPMRYYSLIYRDNPCDPANSPLRFRQAYWALKNMPKYSTDPPTSAVNPLPAYQSAASFTVTWSGTDRSGAGIKNYDVQYRVGGGAWQAWRTQTTATSYSFSGTNGQTYSFRSRATDNADNVGTYSSSGDTTTAVDLTAPSASMNSLTPSQTRTWFGVSWEGSDSTSGIASYDVQYRDGSSGTWRSLVSNTTATSTLFVSGQAGRTYYFRVRATDRAGNVQSFPTTSSSWVQTTAGPDSSGLNRVFMPLVFK